MFLLLQIFKRFQHYTFSLTYVYALQVSVSFFDVRSITQWCVSTAQLLSKAISKYCKLNIIHMQQIFHGYY